jgi:hypothetical protein
MSVRSPYATLPCHHLRQRAEGEIKDSTDPGYEGWKLRGVASEVLKEAAKRAWAEADRNLSGPPPGGWQGH